jgi:hypothetical protein
MSDKHIAIYLNDHLAASVAALELLEQLEAEHRGTPLETLLAGLHVDIAADRQELESLMDRLGIAKSRARQAAVWLSEKASELKLRLDDPAGGDLRLFESLEALSLGIEGKRSLWLALAAAAEDEPALRVLDYQHMARRAEEQRGRAEAARLDAARSVFTLS